MEELWVENAKYIHSEGKDLKTFVHMLLATFTGGSDHGKGHKGLCSRLLQTPPQTSPTSVRSFLDNEQGRSPQGARGPLCLNYRMTKVEGIVAMASTDNKPNRALSPLL